VLHVTVKEKSGAYVTGLSQDALTVLEDGRRQQIQFFGMQDAPVTVGLIIDGSGSMAGVRDRVIAAAGAFAETSNRTDEPRWTPKTGN
jgi:Ca-activated chloride channel family protein